MREALLLRRRGRRDRGRASRRSRTGRPSRLRTYEDAERGLCFGRIDSEESADPLYVGRRWIHDDARRALVVNWQAPAARPVLHRDAGRTARRHPAPPLPHRGTHADRDQRRGARRLARPTPRAVDDFLLEELERAATRACATSSPRSRPTSTT